MLERLRVRNLAIVEDVLLEFSPGLNVLTGETGAGKSLLIEAVSLLLGGRGDAAAVRQGASSLVVEGEFEPGPHVVARVREAMSRLGWAWEGGTIILAREVSAEGKSRASVNQSPATLSALRALGEVLVDIHGQHEHQSLLKPGAALTMLDRAARLDGERADYADRLAVGRAAEDRLAALRDELRTAAEQADYLAHALREIEDAHLREGEDESLRVEAGRRRHAERLRELVAGACGRLAGDDGGVESQLAAAERALEQGAGLDETLDRARATVAEARIAASEAARELARYLEDLGGDPAELQAMEDRRALLASLQRKYRRTEGELIAWAEELTRRLARHESGAALEQAAADECEALRADCVERAARLSEARRAAAKPWGARVVKELRPLGLPRARLGLTLEAEDDPAGVPWQGRHVRLGPQGLDRAELWFAANPGEPPRPLGRIASGGELARVMLALKTVMGEDDRVDMLLFDEVDSGIGGAVAQAVGERLRRLSEHRQVLCVTHLPIIAAQAARQFRVTKAVRQGRTHAQAGQVEGAERVDEIARMLAGELASATTRRQARELLALHEAGRT